MVRNLNSESKISDLQQISICYTETFFSYKKEEILELSVLNEILVFLNYLIPFITDLFIKNEEQEILFQCSKSVSCFIPAKSEMSEILLRLLYSIVSSNLKFLDDNRKILMGNISCNQNFVKFLVSSSTDFINIYNKGVERTEISDIVFEFLDNCVKKCKIKMNQSIIEKINENKTIVMKSHVNLYIDVSRRLNLNLDFDYINLLVIENCDCSIYRELSFLDENVLNKEFIKLCVNADAEFGKKFLIFVLENKSFLNSLEYLIKYIGMLTIEEQKNVIELTNKLPKGSLKSLTKILIPPWISGIDGSVLLLYIKKNKISPINALDLILITNEKEKLISSFQNHPHFQELISGLFILSESNDEIIRYFIRIAFFVSENITSSVDTFISVCLSLQPAFYKDVFIEYFSLLIKNKAFMEKVTILFDEPLLVQELICNDFLKILLENGLFDLIAYLAKNGPYETLDRFILEHFDNSLLAELSENQLLNLVYAIPQDSDNEKKTIRIPSLVPYINNIHFKSAFDSYISGKYLIKNGIIDINSPILNTVGEYYLSRSLSSSAINHSDLLYNLTNKNISNRDLFQFQTHQDDSYILFSKGNFSFSFKVDSFESDIIILDYISGKLIFRKNEIDWNFKIFKCETKQWHTISGIIQVSGALDLCFDSKMIGTIDSNSNIITIGSKLNTPGSTFYVDQNLNFNYQLGQGVLQIKYRGFNYHIPFINAIPRIFQKCIQTETQNDFTNYVKSLINIQKSNNFRENCFISYLRQLLIIKNDLVTEEIIELSLSIISYGIKKIDWNSFYLLFIDYYLWIKLNKKLDFVCQFLLDHFQLIPPTKEVLSQLSLIHFFYDLISFLNISSTKIEELLTYLVIHHDSTISSFTIHLFDKTPNIILRKLIDANPSIINFVPIRFIKNFSNSTSINYLYNYSLNCIDNPSLFDQSALVDLLPFLAKLVYDLKFWISILILMTKKVNEEFYQYRSESIHNKEMIHIVLPLICDFFKSEPNSSLLLEVVDTIVSIIEYNNIELYPFIDDIRNLSHFGVNISSIIPLPIDFGNSFEPCRMMINTVDEIVLNENPIINMSLDFPSSSLFLSYNNLWFGKDPEIFVKACDDLLKKISIPPQNKTDTVKNNVDVCIKTSRLHKIVLQLVTQCLCQLNGKQLSYGLKRLLLLEANVDPEMAIEIHQKSLLQFLRLKTPEKETLSFLYDMICIGWWEKKLSLLFNVLCFSFQRADHDKETYRVFANVIKSIFSLTCDFSTFRIPIFLSLLFSPNLFEYKDYLLFIIHILLSECFKEKIPIVQTSDIWISLFSALKKLELFNLNKIFDIQEDQNFLTMLIDLANSSSFFKQIQQNDIEFYEKIKIKSKEEYDIFINERSTSLPSLTNKMKDYRCNLINRQIVINEEEEEYIFDTFIHEIEHFCFRTRFNMLSLRNEVDCFSLYRSFESNLSNQYQIATSPHPISIPSLYVPFLSKFDINTFRNYEENNNEVVFVGENTLKLSEIPKSVSRFVSQPFFDVVPMLTKFLFSDIFSLYGKIIELNNIKLVYGYSEIQSVLVTSENGFLIVTEALCTQNNLDFILFEQSSSLIIKTFLDLCSGNYYGKCSLFFGHIVLMFNENNILALSERNYLFKNIAIEVWFIRGYSLFLLFDTEKICKKYVEKFKNNSLKNISPDKSNNSISFSVNISKMKNEIDTIKEKWVLKKISTFQYLTIINFLSDRSFSTVSQYPIMPWINKRNLSKPIGQQTSTRNSTFQTIFEETEQHYFYNIFYSSPGTLFHFLFRAQPFTTFLIEFQNGNIIPERVFRSFDQEWESASEKDYGNVEELIPELFVIPEIFSNINNINFSSVKHNNIEFNLPENISNFSYLVFKMRQDLEKSSNIEKWIDLVFGFKSRGKEAVESINLFNPTVYGKGTSETHSQKEIEEYARNCGIIPKQLFTTPHPPKDTIQYGSIPIISNNEQIYSQSIKIPVNEKNKTLLYQNDIYRITNPNEIFEQLKISINIKDLIYNWNTCIFDYSSFSDDMFLFSGMYKNGTISIYQTVFNNANQIISFNYLGTCYIPTCFLDDIYEDFTKCKISSQHNFVCEISSNALYIFHISSIRFIRKINFENDIFDIIIDDIYHLLYGFGKNSIEVFTINGTDVAKTEVQKEITACAKGTNDLELFIITGHDNGEIIFWEINMNTKSLKEAKKLTFSKLSIRSLFVISGGAGLVVNNEKDQSEIFVSRGIKENIIKEEWVLNCACCKNHADNYMRCDSCMLYYCKNCYGNNQGKKILCNQCLRNISNFSEIDHEI